MSHVYLRIREHLSHNVDMVFELESVYLKQISQSSNAEVSHTQFPCVNFRAQWGKSKFNGSITVTPMPRLPDHEFT